MLTLGPENEPGPESNPVLESDPGPEACTRPALCPAFAVTLFNDAGFKVILRMQGTDP